MCTCVLQTAHLLLTTLLPQHTSHVVGVTTAPPVVINAPACHDHCLRHSKTSRVVLLAVMAQCWRTAWMLTTPSWMARPNHSVGLTIKHRIKMLLPRQRSNDFETRDLATYRPPSLGWFLFYKVGADEMKIIFWIVGGILLFDTESWNWKVMWFCSISQFMLELDKTIFTICWRDLSWAWWSWSHMSCKCITPVTHKTAFCFMCGFLCVKFRNRRKQFYYAFFKHWPATTRNTRFVDITRAQHQGSHRPGKSGNWGGQDKSRNFVVGRGKTAFIMRLSKQLLLYFRPKADELFWIGFLLPPPTTWRLCDRSVIL